MEHDAKLQPVDLDNVTIRFPPVEGLGERSGRGWLGPVCWVRTRVIELRERECCGGVVRDCPEPEATSQVDGRIVIRRKRRIAPPLLITISRAWRSFVLVSAIEVFVVLVVEQGRVLDEVLVVTRDLDQLVGEVAYGNLRGDGGIAD